MNYRIAFIVIIALMLAESQNAAAQWVKTSAPDTLRYYAFAETAAHLFAATNGHLLRSTDNGNRWDAFDTSTLSLNGLAASDSILYGWYSVYITSNGDLFRSSDEGLSWLLIDQPRKIYGGDVTCLLVNGDTVFEGQHAPWGNHPTYIYGDLFQSSDDGSDWIQTEAGIETAVTDTDYGPPITALGSNNGNLYTAVGLLGPNGTNNVPGYIYRSSDNGAHWVAVDSNFWSVSFASVDDLIFAGGKQGIIRSSDNGMTWHQAMSGITDTNITGMISTKGRLFATTGTLIYYSSDKGSSWTDVTGNLPSSNGITIFADTENIFVGTSDLFGVWRQLLSDFPLSPAEVQEPSVSSIEISPNPTPGPITVRGAVGDITITNVLGESVMRDASTVMRGGDVELDLSKLPAGTYFARITGGEGPTTVKKIIKE